MRTTLLALTLAAVLFGPAPLASAATRDVNDPSGDVISFPFNPNGDDGAKHREGGAEGDIVFTRVQHTAKQVVVYMRARQLTVPRQYAGFTYTIEGNNVRHAEVSIDTRRRNPQGIAVAYDGDGNLCRLGHRINYAADSVSIRIPRSCLRSPKYVRVVAGTYVHHYNSDFSGTVYYDNAARDGGSPKQASTHPTPWVVTG